MQELGLSCWRHSWGGARVPWGGGCRDLRPVGSWELIQQEFWSENKLWELSTSVSVPGSLRCRVGVWRVTHRFMLCVPRDLSEISSLRCCCRGYSARGWVLKLKKGQKSSVPKVCRMKIGVMMEQIESFRSLPAPGQFDNLKVAFPPGFPPEILPGSG